MKVFTMKGTDTAGASCDILGVELNRTNVADLLMRLLKDGNADTTLFKHASDRRLYACKFDETCSRAWLVNLIGALTEAAK